MSANVDAMVREGINAYRAGSKDEARALLYKAVELDEQHEQAWLWLSAVVDSVEDQQTCLENVLTINPNNERARDGLRILAQRSGSDQAISAPSPASANRQQTPAFADEEDDDPFANISFTDPVTPASADTPFTAPIEDDEDELPSSVDWSAPPATSSASSFRQLQEPSPADYDDWVAGLNLSGGQQMLDEYDDDDDVFDPSPFMVNSDIDDIFKVDDDIDDSLPAFDGADEALTAGPFDAPDDFDDPFMSSPPASKPAAAAKSPMMSPAAREGGSLLSEIEADDFDDIDDFDLDEFDDNLNAIDPSEYFKSIPAEISATRMPGTRERPPIGLLVGVLVFLGLNIGAVALVVMTLTAG